jgi:3-oxoacyl-[acyl-carrier protein] reductase
VNNSMEWPQIPGLTRLFGRLNLQRLMQPTAPLADKVAIVTGAGSGIGRAIAIAYAKAGAAVCCAARSLAEVKSAAEEIEKAGGRAIAVSTDVAVERDVEAMVRRTARRLGRIDILVINAGVYLDRGAVSESASAIWRASLNTNLFGAYLCVRAAIPHLRKCGAGKIITIGSGLGHNGRAGGAAYACSKAGLWMLTRVLAQELWQYNISVNELIPGPVQTRATAKRGGKKGGGSAAGEWFKVPADVIPLALFLATQPDFGPSAQSFSLMRRDG